MTSLVVTFRFGCIENASFQCGGDANYSIQAFILDQLLPGIGQIELILGWLAELAAVKNTIMVEKKAIDLVALREGCLGIKESGPGSLRSGGRVNNNADFHVSGFTRRRRMPSTDESGS